MSTRKTAPKPKQTSKPKPAARKGRSGKRETTAAAGPTKLERLEDLLKRPDGASLEELTEATGWQAHSVRGALAGTLKKKRGHTILSERVDGTRRYRIGPAE